MASRTIKLTLEYDGSDFVGWQVQENGRSVQDVIERALAQILRERIRIVGAGRTDSGVHARGQVASFETESSLNCDQVVRGLNGVLPNDVVVLGVEEAAPRFHARYDALSRRYQYVIKRGATALSRKYCWVVKYNLDIALLKQCETELLGNHDFESFCRSNSTVAHHNCTILNASWSYADSSTLVFDVTADRFLHGMVRALVGTMVEVGRGYRQLEEFRQILEAKDRRKAGVAAPAQGLFLVEVNY